MTLKSVDTLLDVLHFADADTAIVLPELAIRVTYDSLRQQVLAMANALASAGIHRGDAVAIALPNGLPAIVSFLAASIAGTAAPLNPAYPYEEFLFFLGDTNARILLCPAGGAEFARRAAAEPQDPGVLRGNERRGQRSHRRCALRSFSERTHGRRHCPCPAHQRKHGPAKARSFAAFQPRGLLGQHCEYLRAFRGRCFAVHHAAVPRSWPDWLHHGDSAFGRHRGCSHQIQRAFFLAHGSRTSRDLVFRSAHHASASGWPAPTTNRRRLPLCASSVRAARHSRRNSFTRSRDCLVYPSSKPTE